MDDAAAVVGKSNQLLKKQLLQQQPNKQKSFRKVAILPSVTEEDNRFLDSNAFCKNQQRSFVVKDKIMMMEADLGGFAAEEDK